MTICQFKKKKSNFGRFFDIPLAIFRRVRFWQYMYLSLSDFRCTNSPGWAANICVNTFPRISWRYHCQDSNTGPHYPQSHLLTTRTLFVVFRYMPYKLLTINKYFGKSLTILNSLYSFYVSIYFYLKKKFDPTITQMSRWHIHHHDTYTTMTQMPPRPRSLLVSSSYGTSSHI